MERRDFVQKSLGCCGLVALGAAGAATVGGAQPLLALEPDWGPEDPEKLFIQNWVTDLMETLDDEFDEATKRKLMAGCGRGCFKRHSFKTDIARDGKGDRAKLIEAMKRSFEIWEDGKDIHVRFGLVSKGCYCPAARYRKPRKRDLHCYCSAATQQAIFETALGHPVNVEILQSVRRGDPTCHFLVQGA